MELFSLIGKVRVDSTGAIAQLEKIDKKARFVALSFGEIVKKATDIAIGVAIFRGINKSVASLKDAMIGLNAQLEQVDIGFTTMFKSANTSKKMIEELKDFAAKTPFEFPELLEATQRMKALGFEAEELLPTLKAVGDAAAGLGGGKELINRIILALGQMKAKGKVSGEEMRQLAEAGIPAYEMLAEVLGVSIPKAMEMTKKGVVSSEQAVSVFIQKMEERFPNMMKNMENTFQGATSTIRDNIRFIIADLTKGGYEKLKDFLIKVKNLTSQMYDAYRAGGLKKVYEDLVPENVQQFLTPIINSIKNFVETLRNNWETIKYGIKNLLETIAPIIQKIAVIFIDLGTKIVNIISYVADNIEGFKNVVITLGSVIGGLLVLNKIQTAFLVFNKVLNDTTGELLLSAGVAEKFIVALYKLFSATKFVEGLRAVMAALNLTFLTSPVGITVAAIAAAVGGFIAYKNHLDEVKRKQEQFNKTARETMDILKNGIKSDSLEDVKKKYEKLNNMLQQYKQNLEIVNKYGGMTNDARIVNKFNDDYNTAREVVEKLNKEFERMGFTVKLAEERVSALAVKIAEAEKQKKLFDQSDINSEVQKAQEYQNTVNKLEEAIEVYNTLSKKTALNTEENAKLTKAINTLTFIFGENIVIRDKTGKVIGLNTELLNKEMISYIQLAEETKKATLAQIEQRKSFIQAEIKNTETLINLVTAQVQAMYSGTYFQKFGSVVGSAFEQYEKIPDMKQKLAELRKQLSELDGYFNQVKNFKYDSIFKNTSLDSEDNKNKKATKERNEALEKALREYEHLKAMGKLTYEQEINMLTNIMKKYAKTTEEKWDLEEKIYALQVSHNKELQEKAKELQEKWRDVADKVINVYETLPEVAGRNTEEATNKLQKVLESLRISAEKIGDKGLLSKIDSLMKQVTTVVSSGSKTAADKFLKDLTSVSDLVKNKLSDDAKETKNNLVYAFKEAVNNIKSAFKELVDKNMDYIDNLYDKVLNAIENYYRNMLDTEEKLSKERIENKENEINELIRKEKERVNSIISLKQKELEDIEALERQFEDEADIYKYDKKILELKAKLDETIDPLERWKIQQEIAEVEHDKIVEIKKKEFRDKKELIKKEIDVEKQKSDDIIKGYEETLDNFKKSEGEQIRILREITIPAKIAEEKKYFKALMMEINTRGNELQAFLEKYNEDGAIIGQTFGQKLYEGIKTNVDLIKGVLTDLKNSILEVLRLKEQLGGSSEGISSEELISTSNTGSSTSNISSSKSNLLYTTDYDPTPVMKRVVNSSNTSTRKTPSYTTYTGSSTSNISSSKSNLLYTTDYDPTPVMKRVVNSSNTSTRKTPSYTTYTVKKGDTLSEIAQKFRTTVSDIVKLNNIKNPDLIYPNQVFKIPKYHEGGIVGMNFFRNLFTNLKNNEVPAILEVGEMVIPKKYVNNLAFAGVPNNIINNRSSVFNITVYANDGRDAGEKIAQTLKRYGL